MIIGFDWDGTLVESFGATPAAAGCRYLDAAAWREKGLAL